MSNPLLDRKLPSDMADRGQVIEYIGKVSDFARLTEIVSADLAAQSEVPVERDWRAATVVTRLEFAWADAGRNVPQVSGNVAAQLVAVCQRCLEAFDLQVETSFRMLVTQVNADFDADFDEDVGEFANLTDVEIWELDDESLRPLDLVEESLIMAMPLAPTHASRDACGSLARVIPTADDKPAAIRPFADLKSRLEKTNK